MRDEAVFIGAMARQVRDSDSAWAAAPPVHWGNARAREQQPVLEESSCSDADDAECMSEEVVSNTVGLSMPQASGFSGLMGRAATVRKEALRQAAAGQQHDKEGEDADMGETGGDEVMSGPERATVAGHKRSWEE